MEDGVGDFWELFMEDVAGTFVNLQAGKRETQVGREPLVPSVQYIPTTGWLLGPRDSGMQMSLPVCHSWFQSQTPWLEDSQVGTCKSSTVTSEHHCDMPQDNCPEVYLCLSPGLFPPGPLSPLTVPQHPL